MILIYTLTVFLSAFLLFQVQPVIAKYILPWFGGTPAVWSTCMLFFQLLLLGGYAYAHWLSSRLKPRVQAILHPSIIAISVALLIVLGLVWNTPITPGSDWRTQQGETPILNIILLLLVSVGLPYLILSTTGPLIQYWFNRQYPGRSPYRLYSLSNVGSLLALLSYPFIIEPGLRLRSQAWIWSVSYLVFALLCAFLAFRSRNYTVVTNGTWETDNEQDNSIDGKIRKPGLGTKIVWVLLAGCASIMLLAITNHICQEVAVVPFLWVLPLSIYLMTFIICFGHKKLYSRWYLVAFIVIGYYMVDTIKYHIYIDMVRQIVIFTVGLFIFCLMCHGELVRLKPHPKYLTGFYLYVSIGGALGGIFVALIAPVIFDGYWELYVGIVLCLAVVLFLMYCDKSSWVHSKANIPIFLLLLLSTIMLSVFVFHSVPIEEYWNDLIGHPVLFKGNVFEVAIEAWNVYAAIVCLLLAFLYDFFRKKKGIIYRRTGFLAYIIMCIALLAFPLELNTIYRVINKGALYKSRNFFGVLRVCKENDRGNEFYSLVHGTIIHGSQYTDPEMRNKPLSYFSIESGLGRLMSSRPEKLCDENGNMRIGDIGLGIGTLASYVREGDYLCFYEINPEVEELAKGEGGFFHYLEDCTADVDIVLGDGRLSLERQYREGGSMQYDVLVLDAFNSDSVPVHLLTREAFQLYLKNLKPNGVIVVNVSNLWLSLDPVIWKQADYFNLKGVLIKTSGEEIEGASSVSWMLLSRDGEILEDENISRKAKQMPKNIDKYPLWTDDFSNLFQCVR